MKRLLGLLLASTLVLGACGSDGNKKKVITQNFCR